MLDVVDTPYRGRVSCLLAGALCSASVWRIHHINHNTPPLYGVSTKVVRISSLACYCTFKVDHQIFIESSPHTKLFAQKFRNQHVTATVNDFEIVHTSHNIWQSGPNLLERCDKVTWRK